MPPVRAMHFFKVVRREVYARKAIHLESTGPQSIFCLDIVLPGETNLIRTLSLESLGMVCSTIHH